MTRSNWQADMLNRLGEASVGEEPTSPEGWAPPNPAAVRPDRSPAPTVQPPAAMPPPPAPTGPGWGEPVPPYAGQQPAGPPSPAPSYSPPPGQAGQPLTPYDQGWSLPPFDASGGPPPTPHPYQGPPQGPPGYQGPPYQGPPPQYGGPYQGPPPQGPPGYGQGRPPADGGWGAPGEQAPAPGGPPPAYTPAYHDPLAGPLPVATAPVGLQHQEEEPGSGGLLRRIGRFAAEAAYIAGASGRMQRDVENIAAIRRPIGIGRMIGIIGPVPQSGTSVVAALLADTLASQRSDEVLAVDADPHEGKLSRRLELAVRGPTRPRIQLARAEPTEDGVRAVLSGRNVGGANQIPISLVDCPAGLYEPATTYVASAAHALALAIPSARNGATYSIDLLDQLTPDGQQMLVEKGIVVIAETWPNDPEPVRWLQSAVSDRGLTYVVLPYDAHLAQAWPLHPDRLEPATRRSVLELAARLVDRATH